MTPVPTLSNGPELFVYTFGSAATLVASAVILWAITYMVDRMQE